MKFSYLVGTAGLALATPAMAQIDDINSASNSAANANSGSVSGASADGNVQGQGQTQTANNAGIGSSASTSGSASEANSGSVSNSGAVSDQAQGQSLSNANQLGATNQQGVSVSNTFNSTNHKRSYVGTNAAVPLAASSSFSSDYCGGTASGGASIAPIGVSIGGAAPTFDKSCQYLRLAEKAGMLGANYHNMQQPDMSLKAMSLMAWATCMAGPQNDKRRKGYEENVVMQACLTLGLLGSTMSPMSPPPRPAPEPATQTSTGYPTPEAVERYKTPRGEADPSATPSATTPAVTAATSNNTNTLVAASVPRMP